MAGKEEKLLLLQNAKLKRIMIEKIKFNWRYLFYNNIIIIIVRLPLLLLLVAFIFQVGYVLLNLVLFSFHFVIHLIKSKGFSHKRS